MTGRYAAVDLGASSGRVVVGTVGPGHLELEEVHRFSNGPVRLPDGYRWDVLHLWREILVGLRRANDGGALTSVGVDSWAIDHGLLDRDGALLGNPWHHRDSRTDGVADRLFRTLPADELYRINGLQHLPFTTLYQLLAAKSASQTELAEQMLLVPDLLVHWLTGIAGTERTNASTTGLLDATTGEWSTRVLHASGLRASLLAPLRSPGQVVGPLLAVMREETGLGPDVVVTTVGSHDTASAVVGVPADGPRFAYVACGTWALVGVELDGPVLTDESREANFTNEAGVDGTVRYLRNVMGLWVLSESIRTWEHQGRQVDLGALLAAAEQLPEGGPVVDIDDPSLLPPGDMPARIDALCRESGQPVPESPAATVRCIVESLAQAFARAVSDAVRISGRTVDVVHVVGGGSQNRLLCRLTADATGLPVLAGPVEATALGNVLVQARAHGDVTGGLDRSPRPDPRDPEPAAVPAREGRRLTVRIALFATCLVDGLFPSVGRATVRLLERLGHEVVVPEAQVCCGQMHVNTGYLDDALPIVRNHVRAFDGCDVVVAASGSCVGSVRHQQAMVAEHAGDTALADDARQLAGRTYELTELLVDVLGLVDVGAWFPHRVTYHPTCHSLRLLRVGERPLTLLRHVQEIDLVELPQAESCCGFGGTFALKNHAVSSAMLDDKVRSILATGASVCTAGDSSCLLHIGGGLSRLRSGARAVHLAEVLAGTRAEPWEEGE